MKILIMTIGLPRSGKSTWAKEQGHPIVNPDSIRLALHGQNFVEESELMVWCMTKYMVKALFNAGHTFVILDATNLTFKRRDFWKDEMWERKFIYFRTGKEVCITRAKIGNRLDLIPIIEKMDREKQIDLLEINGVIDG